MGHPGSVMSRLVLFARWTSCISGWICRFGRQIPPFARLPFSTDRGTDGYETYYGREI